ncbi:MAG: hypothetical protein A2161_02075 [Candidatus Schekmanbacteria bacterium RBG_13_48_7]|uniref:Polymerase nucleotidyl transferase domain-containing protein n=1 Tax=Candidatus Schekmanbacteria bacterium RBG_13_48_7 TaxID=1817878 RepID=A0A1F7RYI1_9BACT|nr:MAG: hypothetical protein A2161_02075 [Candidatus Schekmanbacteria bacterium RBG_13_48_7]
MPVKSLNSSILKWPDKESVGNSLKKWISTIVTEHDNILQIICIGSFARDDWGPGSDIDLIIVMQDNPYPFWQRPAQWDTAMLPVPAELRIYTLEEWEKTKNKNNRFWNVILKEGIQVYPQKPGSGFNS